MLDFGHMYQSLARLDAGDDEKILLTSRDKRSLLVVSFADIKRCLDEAFAEVFGHAAPSPGGSAGGGGDVIDGLPPGEAAGAGGAGGAAPGGEGGDALAGGRGFPPGVAPIHGGMAVVSRLRGDARGMGLVGHPHAHPHAHPHGHPHPHAAAHRHHAHGQTHGLPLGHPGHHPHGMAMSIGMVGHPGPPSGPPGSGQHRGLPY